MAADGAVHPLSLKVMRLSRPELAGAWQPFYSSSPSFSAHSSASILSLQGNKPLPTHPKTLRDLTQVSELLNLPSSFGSIQLGELFSGCLCVNNETQVEVDMVQFKVEMQTVTTKVTLYDSESGGEKMHGGQTIEKVVSHEIKELGQHVLACGVSYRAPPGFRPVPGSAEDPNDPTLLTFRKFYKFAVANPLSVKTKVHAVKSPSALLSLDEREKIFLEVHIQNLTQSAIYFERMHLECTDAWTSVDVNLLPGVDEDEEDPVFSGTTALLQPQDLRQYVYILTPKTVDLVPTVQAPGSIIPLGRLDIAWRSQFGEPGRLLTSMLSRRIPLPPVLPQPVSAVPPYLKRNVPSRPHTPTASMASMASQSFVSRPSSPVPHRAGSMSVASPTSPYPPLLVDLAPSTIPLPDLEAHLVIRKSPPSEIKLNQELVIPFTLVLMSNPVAGKENVKRHVRVIIQHLRTMPVIPVAPVHVTAGQQQHHQQQPGEAFSPRLPSSGFSTPTSTSVGFNYALAHQKLLAASSRTALVEAVPLQTPQESVEGQAGFLGDGTRVVLPPPYFEGNLDELKVHTNGVVYSGPSTISLDLLELSLVSNEGSKPDEKLKVRAVQDFEVVYIPVRTGFHTIGGIRILALEDRLVEGDDNPPKRKASTVKEYEVIGEVWVTS